MWLIDEMAGRALSDARASGAAISAEQLLAFESQSVVAAGDPKNTTRAGSSMEIRVEGVLTEKPDLFAAWFGGGNTTYDSIVQALAIAAADPTIKEVVFRVNSPGGTVDGLFDALAAIESFRVDSGKKSRVIASKAQSAAFAIAAMAGPITAKTPASMFGSVGTAIDFTVYSTAKTLSITNTDSPAKRPDPTTDEGRAEIVKFLDAVNGLFVDAIARGRGTTADEVSKNYGRGASFVAGDAKKLGMIDALAKPIARSANGPKAEDQSADVGVEENQMKLSELKAQHPDVYEAAVAEGVTSERDRVVAHLTMGEAFGGIKTAIAAVKDGSAMTASLSATYMAHAANKTDIALRQQESNAVAAAAAGVSAVANTSDLGDLVVARMFGGE